MKARIALYNEASDAEPKPLDLDWPELVELLTTHEQHCDAASCLGRDCPAKNGDLWSPVEIDGPRADDNVTAVTAFVGDLDHCTMTVDEILKAVSPYACVLHSTHSHSPEDPCYRFVLPLSRPATHAEWPAVRRAIVETLGLPCDPSCKDRSRMYFLPTARGGIPPVAVSRPGNAVEVDEALQIAGSAPPSAPIPTPSVSVEALRASVERARNSKASSKDAHKKAQAEILARVLDGKPLAQPHGGRDGLEEGRDTTILRACGLIARHAPADTTWPTALELLRPSLTAMDTNPEGLDHWVELTRVKYERAAKARAVQDERAASDAAAMREVAKAATNRKIEPGDANEAWQEGLILKGGEIRITECNALDIIRNAEELKDGIRWDEFSKRTVICGGPLAGVAPASVETELAAWVQRNYHFFGSSEMIGRCAQVVARKNPIDTLREYLGELAWDGEQRIDRFLVDYLGAEDTEYVRMVSRRWLISLAARGLQPGCQVDTVLILEGPQGAGKSSVLRDLVGAERFLDTALELGDKDTMQAIASVWLVELGELASLSRAEAARVKQFVTSRVDKFRPPYGKVIEEHPRRCVFVGTTNDEQYLTDRTGNRRYWPVRVGNIDRISLRRDREKILAEAVAMFTAGERWWLNETEQAAAEMHADERLVDSALGEKLVRWWYGTTPAQRPKRVSMTDIGEALLIPAERFNQATRAEVGAAMKRLGFKRQRKTDDGTGKLVRYYVPTEALLNVPQETSTSRARYLSLVDAVKGK